MEQGRAVKHRVFLFSAFTTETGRKKIVDLLSELGLDVDARGAVRFQGSVVGSVRPQLGFGRRSMPEVLDPFDLEAVP